jgi:hypothetical protein
MHPLTVLFGIGLLLLWMGKNFIIGLVVILVVGAIAAFLIPSNHKQRSETARPGRTKTSPKSLRPPTKHMQPMGSNSSYQGTDNQDEDASLPKSGLIVRPEPLDRILSGQKTWEMRSITTSKRELVALIAKGGREILGVARIADVRGKLSDEAMIQTINFHGIAPERLHLPEVENLRYAWVLTDVVRFTPPVPYEPRSGAVRFVNLSLVEREAIRAKLRGEA